MYTFIDSQSFTICMEKKKKEKPKKQLESIVVNTKNEYEMNGKTRRNKYKININKTDFGLTTENMVN